MSVLWTLSQKSTTLESLDNLEQWAARRGLAFTYNQDTNTWSLEPLQQGDDVENETA